MRLIRWDMKLVVGLGNPGPEYLGTRHNIGFEVIDALAVQLGWISQPGQFELLARSRFEGLLLDGLVNLSDVPERLLLLKPMTYMNRSGGAVQAAVSFFQIPLSSTMIVLDDLALRCGQVRMRAGGSSGGHNGLKDIEQALGTSAYPRLRIGLDAPPPHMDSRDYVLGRPTPEQRQRLDAGVARAVQALLAWMGSGIDAAMSRFNAEPQETDQQQSRTGSD